MTDWVTITEQDLSHEEAPRPRGHSFRKAKGLSWPAFCKHCGLCDLKNPISRYLARVGCHYESDPRYLRWRKTGAAP